MLNWLHRLLEPHCQECAEAKRELAHCKSCDILQQQLERANYEKDLLLQQLFHKSEEAVRVSTEDLEPLRPNKHIPWSVRKRELEENDRHTAKLLREQDQKSAVQTTISKLEELVIGEQQNKEERAS